MVSNQDDQTILQNRLARILGWDEAGEEMLELLVSMESDEDVLEYLEQLLGRSDDTIHQFISDISKFKEGKPISVEHITTLDELKVMPKSSQTNKDDIKYNESKSIDYSSTNRDTKKKRDNFSNSTSKPKSSSKKEKLLNARKSSHTKPVKGTTRIKNKTATKITDKIHTPIIENNDAKKAIPVLTSAIDKISINVQESEDKSSVSILSEKPAPPKIGKAKRICGCFGTKCKALTNCLNCGRILCEKEGYGYCPYCNHLVERLEPTTRTGDRKNDLATIHKERLLKFDREFTKRTVIYDDQSDYYSNATSTWINESERKAESQKEEERRQKLHERQKQVLDITF